MLISAGHLYIRTEVFCEGLLVLHVRITKRASAAVVFEPRETPWYTYLFNVLLFVRHGAYVRRITSDHVGATQTQLSTKRL